LTAPQRHLQPRSRSAGGPRHDPVLTDYLAGSPTPRAQAALLRLLSQRLSPVVLANGLPEFEVRPGLRLCRAYGRCRWLAGPTPRYQIAVRCTADGDRAAWRRLGAITGTLLHELAHLRWRGHGQRFWTLHRRLVDQAVAAGLYEPADRDAAERAQGDEKLAGSAADSVAAAARRVRRERARVGRLALTEWEPGQVARITPTGGRLAGVRVRVLARGRTRLEVQTPDGGRYRVAPSLLQHA
jgi:WLM domain